MNASWGTFPLSLSIPFVVTPPYPAQHGLALKLGALCGEPNFNRMVWSAHSFPRLVVYEEKHKRVNFKLRLATEC